jgi:hypothetical protein
MAKDSKKSKKSSKDDRSVSSRSTRREKSPKQGKSSKEKSKRGKSPKRDKDSKSSRKDVKGDRAALLLSSKNPENVLEYIPEDYLVNPETAEPVLHFLPKMIASSEPTGTSTVGSSVQSNTKFPNLRVLLAAAEDDIRLHRARVQAAKFTDITYLRSYKIESDEQWLVRQQRLNERKLMLNKLNTERSIIMKELQASNVKGLTAHEMKQVQLARWQRALELFVYAPPVEEKETDADNEEEELEFLGLLEKLLEGITEVRFVGHESDMLCSSKTSLTLSRITKLIGRRHVCHSVAGRRHVQYLGGCYKANCQGCVGTSVGCRRCVPDSARGARHVWPQCFGEDGRNSKPISNQWKSCLANW